MKYVKSDVESRTVLVVGAGIAGIYLVHALSSRGLDVMCVERATDVGGTWFWNRYPGARCDQESLYYSYSFDAEVEQEWNWTERYPTQPEILQYLNFVADRFGVRDHIVFNTSVISAAFDETIGRWLVQTDTGRQISCQFLVMATGCLSEPNIPVLPGLEQFSGEVYLTARWPHAGVDFMGKKVAVIGTGSSGIQCIPLLAEQALHLTVFQRTPSFSLPAKNAPLSPETLRDVKQNYPEIRRKMRMSNFGSPRVIESTQSALEVSASVRDATYEKAFEFGHLGALVQTYNDLLTNREANDTAADYVRGRIRQIVDDPSTAELLVPHGYPLGTKRPCLDTGYYSTYNRSNVSLVSTVETPIVKISSGVIETTRSRVEIDSIVLATGFDAITGALSKVAIAGRGGQLLSKYWQDGPSAYLGLAISNFPNLFTVTGPGSPSVLSNMVVSIEQHVEWIVSCIVYMREIGHNIVEVDPEAELDWMAKVADVAAQTLFLDANSWYLGANIPGKPRVFMPFVGGVGTFRNICDKVVEEDYRGFKFG